MSNLGIDDDASKARAAAQAAPGTPVVAPGAARPRGTRVPLYLGGLGIFMFVTLVALRVFVVSYHRVPSGGMLPTLGVNSHIFVNKLARTPRRGDMILFQFPEHPEQDFVKRVIALHNDVLEARGGHPFLNGWPVPSCRVGEWSYQDSDAYAGSGSSQHKGDVYVEFLEDSAYLTFYDSVGLAFQDHQGPFVAKAGEAWVMGDNRNNSHDSRMWYGGQGGGVPPSLVRGRVITPRQTPTLPSAMSGLAAGLAKCLASRPSVRDATPPSSHMTF